MKIIIAGNKHNKTSKGYRLKMTTHKLIDRIQEMMQCSQDEVITRACKMLYKELKLNNTINNGVSK